MFDPRLIVAACALVAPLSAEDTSDETAPQVEESRRCGLGREFHAGRRALLRERLAAEGGGVVCVRGLPTTRDYVRFHQDKTFWYLTGVSSPNAALVMDVDSGREILLLPRPDFFTESWEGELWDAEDDWVPGLTGFGEIRPSHALVDTLRELCGEDERQVWIYGRPAIGLSASYDRATPYERARQRDPLDGRAGLAKTLQAKLESELGVKVRKCTKVIDEMRRVKTSEEAQALRRASQIGAEAQIEAIRSSRPGLYEWELDALMTWTHRRMGADGPGYQAIIGSGPNSLVLHYLEVTRALEPAEVVLIDYGPQFDHYVTDITRTWPTDGEWTPRMAELYDAVLAAQQAGIDAVTPGITMGDVDAACSRVLTDRGFKKLMRHGACHYVGMEVHDVGSARKPLEPGVTFTIEPGLYDKKAGIGIRIEDVVLVTEDGCEVLSGAAPRDRAALTDLVRESGILDREGAPGR